MPSPTPGPGQTQGQSKKPWQQGCCRRQQPLHPPPGHPQPPIPLFDKSLLPVNKTEGLIDRGTDGRFCQVPVPESRGVFPTCSEDTQWALVCPPTHHSLACLCLFTLIGASEGAFPAHTRSVGRAFIDCATGLGPRSASFSIQMKFL